VQCILIPPAISLKANPFTLGTDVTGEIHEFGDRATQIKKGHRALFPSPPHPIIPHNSFHKTNKRSMGTSCPSELATLSITPFNATSPVPPSLYSKSQPPSPIPLHPSSPSQSSHPQPVSSEEKP
ncbi:hypothetical protein CC78DRAFT_599410, partial [Lojkania enalia]